MLKKFTIELLKKGEADKRAFRFCIKRLEVLAHCPEFDVPAAYFSDITPLVIEAMTRNPAATDQLARYLRAVPVDAVQLNQIANLLRNLQKSIYTWQCYCLWTLLIHKKHRDAALFTHALKLVAEGLGQFPRRRGGGWVRQIALTSFLPGAVVIDFPDDLCAAA